jgi:hypothetical protein
MSIYITLFWVSYILTWVSLFLTRNKDGFFYTVATTYKSHTKILLANLLIFPSLLFAFHASCLLISKKYTNEYNKHIGRDPSLYE